MLRVRKRIDRLDGGEQDRLRAAFRALMGTSDPRGDYKFWASIHKSCCPHKTEWFLPWHRAYIFAFEEALRATRGGADVTLPYWDWTVIRKIPDLVQLEPLTSDRNSNPNPNRLPSRAQIDQTISDPSFKHFGGRGCRPNDCWGGCLENLHGLVHTWVGPVMGNVGTAAFDPLFWFHHAYVDRVWSMWQSRHTGDPSCVGALQGVPGNWTVADVLNIAGGRLGYTYDDETLVIRGPYTLDVDRSTLRVEVPGSVLSLGARIRLDAVRVLGEGEPPIELELQSDDGVSEPVARLSLFGVGSHHEHSPETRSDCEHLSGSFAACLARSPTSSVSVTGGLTFRAVWSPDDRSRSGITIGAIVIGDV